MLSDKFDEYLKRYNANRVVCREGESGDSFFLIKEGLAEVTRHSGEETSVVLSTLGPGEIFGEMALLNEDPVRSATVRTKTRLTCWKFSGNKFEALLEQSEEFRRRVMKLLNERLRDSNRKLSHIQSLQRLVYQCSFLLLDLADRLGPSRSSTNTVEFSPAPETLKEWFDEPAESLQTLMQYPSPDDLKELSAAVQDRLLHTARNLVEQGLDQLQFAPSTGREPLDPDELVSHTDREELRAQVESLHSRLCERSPVNDQKTLEQFRREYQSCKDQFNHSDFDNRSGETSRIIETYLDEIRRILFSEQEPDGTDE